MKITHGVTAGIVTRSALLEDGPVIQTVKVRFLPAHRVKLNEVSVQYSAVYDDLNRLVWASHGQARGFGHIIADDGTLTDRDWRGPLETSEWLAKVVRWLTPGPFPLRSNAALYIRTDGELS